MLNRQLPIVLAICLLLTNAQSSTLDKYNVIAPTAGLLLGTFNQYFVCNNLISFKQETGLIVGGMLVASLPEIIKKSPTLPTHSQAKERGKEYYDAKAKVIWSIVKPMCTYGVGYLSGYCIGDFLFKPIK